MIKLISNLKVNSVTLEKTLDASSNLVLNKVSVSTSFESSSSLQKMKSLNLRLFISLDKETSKVLDFVSQRYSEFLADKPEDISSQQLNDYLERTLKKEGNYLKHSNPFSPYSTDLETRDLVITNRVSKFGKGRSVANNTIIYDAPVTEIYSSTTTTTFQSEPLIIILPATSQDISQMSVYAFVYDTRVPRIFKDEPQNNFSISTGMSPLASLTLIGEQDLFLKTSQSNPLVGMEIEKTLFSPDKDKLLTIDAPPQDAVDEQYVKLEKQAQKLFTSFRFDRTYELNKTIKKENYFSDLWLSTDTTENCKFVFAFDLRSYLKMNSIFPFIYESDVLAKAVITGGDEISPDQLSSVIYTEVRRSPIHKNGHISVNDLGTVGKAVRKKIDGTFPQVVVPNIKKVDIKLLGDGISEAGNHELCFYEGVDDFGYTRNPNRQIDGRFQYSAKCMIRDNSPDLIRNLVNLMTGIKRSTNLIHLFLTDAHPDLSAPPIYDSKAGRLLRDIKNITMPLDGKIVDIHSVLLENINKYQFFIGSLTSEQAALDLVTYYQKSFGAADGRINPHIIKDFERLVVSGIKILEDKLLKVFPLNPYEPGDDTRSFNFSHNSNKSVRNNILTTQHTFSEIHEKGYRSGYGVDYIFDDQKNEKSLNTITLGSYETRRIDEFRKYFSGGKGTAEIVPDGSYEGPSYAYLTPKTIITPNRPLIDQTKYATESSIVVEYDYDRYGQLFGDMIELNRLSATSNIPYPFLAAKPAAQADNNKLYSSVSKLLSEQFGLKIKEVITPQFNSPKVSTEKSATTIYSAKNRSACGNNGGPALIPSVIGGETAQSADSVTYLAAVDDKIKNENTERSKGDIDARNLADDRKERAIRLPIAILGEMSLDKSLDLTNDAQKNTYNSLTALGNILDISQKNISQALETFPVALLPNQLKSMLVISSTNAGSSLGASSGGESFDACRPRLRNISTDQTSSDVISFYGDDKDVPPYPQTEDPMKSYAQFLAFWMNYRKIGVVEYLNNFNTLKPSLISNEKGQKLKLPNWSLLNSSTAKNLSDQGGALLCRVRPMSTDDYLRLVGEGLSASQHRQIVKFFETRDLLNVPTYNKYFYIQSNNKGNKTNETSSVSAAQQAAPSDTFFTGY